MSDERQGVKEYSAEDVKKLQELVRDGCSVLDEIFVLKGGLADTVKAISEELGIKAAQLNKVIRLCYKQNLEDERHKWEEVEDLVETIKTNQKH